MKANFIFLAILGIIFAISIPLIKPGGGEGDFSAYWAAARLFITGGNPYSQAEMSQLQYQITPEWFSQYGGIKNAWNPPWLILALAPLAILPYSLAVSAWIFCNTLIIGAALIFTWKMSEGKSPSSYILLAFVAGFLFGETISYLASGQITAIVLISLVLTLWFLQHDQDLLAGIALLFTTIKPHLSYFVILLILIYIIKNHRWKVFIGLISSAIVSMIIFWIVLPGWVREYVTLMSSLPYSTLYTSTFGSFVSEKFNISIFKYSAVLLILFIPTFLRLIKTEGWMTAANTALLVSIPLSPFGFNFDQILILPAIVQVIAWISAKKIPGRVTGIAAAGFLLTYLLLFKLISINGLEQYWFFWIPIAVLCIYLFVRNARHAS